MTAPAFLISEQPVIRTETKNECHRTHASRPPETFRIGPRDASFAAARLQESPGLEGLGVRRTRDQYDALTPTCLLGVDRRDVVDCVRLLPTTGPNILADTFPVLLDGRAAPKNVTIWESSRFCVDTQNVAATAENGLKE